MATTAGAPVGGTVYPPYDAERAAPQGYGSSSSHTHQEKPLDPLNLNDPKRPTSTRNPSWDLLGNIKKLEQSYEQFDTRNASQTHLIYAEGDLPENKVRVWLSLAVMSLYVRRRRDLGARGRTLQAPFVFFDGGVAWE